jgi:hypothetical protein
MRYIVVLWSLLLMVGCSGSFEMELTPEVRVFVSADSDKQITLSAEDEEYVLLNNWLQTHKSGWMYASGRYPGGVYIKSGDYGIQVAPQHIVIYLTKGPEPKAIYLQHIGPEDLVAVKSLGQ